MKVLRDTWLIFSRQIQLLLRQPTWVLVGIFQPIMYLLLFAPLLKPALSPLGVTSDADVYRVFVPGLLVLLAIFGGLFSGFSLIAELRAGVIERSRVTPVSRFATSLARCAANGSWRDRATARSRARSGSSGHRAAPPSMVNGNSPGGRTFVFDPDSGPGRRRIRWSVTAVWAMLELPALGM